MSVYFGIDPILREKAISPSFIFTAIIRF